MTLIIEIEQTASGGVWSFNTQNFTENVFLKQIIVKNTTADATYDFYILDGTKNSIPVYDTRTGRGKITGTLNEQVEIPLFGIHTVGVINSSLNEAFTGKLVISEGLRGF